MEREYNVPLRKEWLKVPRYRRAKKAVTAMKEFLSRHMKSENVKLSKEVNEKIWGCGMRNPPHHVKIIAVKDEEGVVTANLFGAKTEIPMEEKKEKPATKEEKKEAPKEKPAKEEKAEKPAKEKPEAEPAKEEQPAEAQA